MEHSTELPSLTTVQHCVANALAAGSTLTAAAESCGVHRVTVYRWVKTRPEFTAAIRHARAGFVLARRDDLHNLSNRALETLLAVLDNPRAAPSVLLRTAMFVLQRPQLPKVGWSMPEPTPKPDDLKLLDSAIIEQDYDVLPGLYNIENEDLAEFPVPAATHDASDATECNQMQHEFEICADVAPAHATELTTEVATEPTTEVATGDATKCNQMQHNFEICADVAPNPGLRSCPVPPDVQEARKNYQGYLDALDIIRSIEKSSPV